MPAPDLDGSPFLQKRSAWGRPPGNAPSFSSRTDVSPAHFTSRPSLHNFSAHVVRCFNVMTGVALLAAIDWLTGLGLSALQLPFPSFVAALLVLFLGLSISRCWSNAATERVSNWALPTTHFLARWMAVFFVPPLVLLPLTKAPDGRDVLLLLVLVGGGFVATFWVTGWVALRTIRPVAVQPAAHRPVNVWKPQTLLWLWTALSLLCVWIWTSTHAALARVGLGIALCVLGFVTAEWGRVRLLQHGRVILGTIAHPVPVAAAFVICCWTTLGLDLRQFWTQGNAALTPGQVLSFFLRPAVVSFALTLDTQRHLLRAHAVPLLLSVVAGAIFSLFASACAAWAVDLEPQYARALLSRSVTTAVALSMADELHAHAGLTALIVVSTGLAGALFVPRLFDRFGFTSAFVLGVATGASSHGIGTAALAREHPLAAAFSGITFALMAVVSMALVSNRLIVSWLLALVG